MIGRPEECHLDFPDFVKVGWVCYLRAISCSNRMKKAGFFFWKREIIPSMSSLTPTIKMPRVPVALHLKIIFTKKRYTSGKKWKKRCSVNPRYCRGRCDQEMCFSISHYIEINPFFNCKLSFYYKSTSTQVKRIIVFKKLDHLYTVTYVYLIAICNW